MSSSATGLTIGSFRTELRLMYPAEPGLLAHCQRVAALAWELGRLMDLSAESQLCLREAALTHHYPIRLLDSEFVTRLLQDIWAPAVASFPGDSPSIPAGVRAILQAFHSGSPEGYAPNALLADILEFCNLFDERIEGLPFDNAPAAQAMDELLQMARHGMWDRSMARALEQLPCVDAADLPGYPRLQVAEAAVIRMLALHREAITEAQLHRMAISQPGIAAGILRAANSAAPAGANEITSVPHAIAVIGVERGRRVGLAAAIEPLFEAANLSALWLHSVNTAELMARLAVLSGSADPEEAYAAGLLHDIGRVAVQSTGAAVAEMQDRLLEKDCPTVCIEALIFRRDHGEIGADILDGWNIPEPLTSAVRHHHRPELSDSTLTALLYVAESWSDVDEDLPSCARWNSALARTGLTLEMLLEQSSRVAAVSSLSN